MRAEQIFDALDAFIKANTNCFKNANFSRVQYWTDVSYQPAVGLRQTGAIYEYVGQGLRKTTLKGEIFIYVVSSNDSAAVPRTALNDATEEVLDCFQPDCGRRDEFTIGMPEDIYHCRIEGEVTYAPGDVGPQSIALLPVRILLNG